MSAFGIYRCPACAHNHQLPVDAVATVPPVVQQQCDGCKTFQILRFIPIQAYLKGDVIVKGGVGPVKFHSVCHIEEPVPCPEVSYIVENYDAP